MKLERRLFAVGLVQILLILLMAAAYLTRKGGQWLPLFLAAEALLVLYGTVAIFFPLHDFHKTIGRIQNADSIDALMKRMDDKEPYVKELKTMMSSYVAQETRYNAAQMMDKQTELTALQSQINPHFLYNTLDTIRGQAMIDDNEVIALEVEALSSFFRYSISGKGGLVTLREELANVQNYMLIQKYRFSNRFSLEVEIEEEDKRAYDFLIPRLIIQPVIENAIFHGLEDKLEGGKITIEVLVTDKLLFLTISDNGKGMERKKLDALNERITSTDKGAEDTQKPREGRHRNTGIALPNIHRRIQILFGEEYGIHVYSTVGQGTDVEIIMPADYHPPRQDTQG